MKRTRGRVQVLGSDQKESGHCGRDSLTIKNDRDRGRDSSRRGVARGDPGVPVTNPPPSL